MSVLVYVLIDNKTNEHNYFFGLALRVEQSDPAKYLQGNKEYKGGEIKTTFRRKCFTHGLQDGFNGCFEELNCRVAGW